MEDVLVIEETPGDLAGLSVLKEAVSKAASDDFKMIYFKIKSLIAII